jgi:hypothetical protein
MPCRSEGAFFATEESRILGVEILTALPKEHRDDVARGASVALLRMTF